MKKGKYLIDTYKKLNDKSFKLEDAVKFFVDNHLQFFHYPLMKMLFEVIYNP